MCAILYPLRKNVVASLEHSCRDTIRNITFDNGKLNSLQFCAFSKFNAVNMIIMGKVGHINHLIFFIEGRQLHH